MRSLAWLVVVVVSTSAWADKKIQGLIPQLEREHTACQTQTSGLQKVATGAAALAKTLEGTERAEVERDAEALAKGATQFTEYCAEVAAMVAYLKEQANATYRSVEREIDTRDNKVRKLRRDAKKLLEDLGPTTRRMIPRIARVPATPAEVKRTTPTKFPSGRTVELPSLPGTWRVSGSTAIDNAEYEDKKLSAKLSTSLSTGTCDEESVQIQNSPFHKNLEEIEVPKGVAYAYRFVRGSTPPVVVIQMCTSRTGGRIEAVGEIQPQTAPIIDDMTKVMFRMLAARTPKT